MVSHGMPPRDNDVQRELADLRRHINQMHGMIVQATNTANAATTKAQGFQSDLNNTNFPSDNAYHEYASTTVTVPAGYNYALLLITAQAGTTFTGAGNIAVSPGFGHGMAGSGMDSGVSGAAPCSVSSIFCEAITVTPGATLTLSAFVATNGAQSAGAGNVHVSGYLSFSR